MRKKKPYRNQMTDREKELMAIRKPVVCQTCRETSAIFPKAVGFHPYEWEMNCTLCHHYAVGLDAYDPRHEEVINALQELRKEFLAGKSTDALSSQIENLAYYYDSVLINAKCECGGILSIAAKPKCVFCDLEIFDSYFHFADQLV